MKINFSRNNGNIQYLAQIATLDLFAAFFSCAVQSDDRLLSFLRMLESIENNILTEARTEMNDYHLVINREEVSVECYIDAVNEKYGIQKVGFGEFSKFLNKVQVG